MIIFDLSCKQNHQFEGWFQSQTAYDRQLESGLVSCPHCGSRDIRRVPSAVHLTRPATIPATVLDRPAANTPPGILAAYRQLMSAILANSDDVGKDFASEARRIYYREVPQRSIRGEASADEYEDLREEGIEVLRLPVLKKEDLN